MKKISENELVKLVYAFEKKTYIRNEVLFEEGQTAHAVYFLKKGEVQVKT
jgi:CRP-like cAMP-binding protein